MREGYIYKITNRVNDKCYIGQTVQKPILRWKQHRAEAYSGTPWGSYGAFHDAIREYGPMAFTFEVIAETLEPFLDDLEIMFIRLYCSTVEHHGYNVRQGGHLIRDRKQPTKVVSPTLGQVDIWPDLIDNWYARCASCAIEMT